MSSDYSNSIVKIIHECLRFNRTSIEKTKHFKDLKHNKHLCPLLEEQLNSILNYFNKYRNLVYDIQGFSDEGSDVILFLNKDENQKTICFQMKAHDELVKGGGIITKIGFQYTESMKRYDPLEYYLIPCAYPHSEISKRQTMTDRLRQIRSKFSDYERMTIIDPTEFAFFSQLTSEQIGTVIKLEIEPDDLIYKKCLEILQELDRLQRFVFLRVIVLYIRNGFKALNQSTITEDPTLINYIRKYRIILYGNNYNYALPKDYKGRYDLLIYFLLEILDQKYIHLNEEEIEMDLIRIEPLITFILDNKIRCNFNDTELINFLNQIFIEDYT